MSQPLFASSAESPLTGLGGHGPQTKVFQQHSPEKSIQQELEENKANKKSHYTEKVTPIKFVLFVIFIISYQIIINLRTNFTKQLNVNTAIGQYFLNQVSDYIDYPAVDSEKLRFNDINTIDEVSQWIRETIIDGLYSDHNGNLYTDTIVENALLYPSITALRVLQKRAKLKSRSDNANFEYIWDLSTNDDDTTTFSSFTYNSKQEGFNVTIPVPFYTRDEALTMYNDAVTAGFYDEQTKQVELDFTVMNIYESLATHFQADFYISPTGRIKKTRVEIVSYSARFYTDTRGKASIFFQLVFIIMFLYYFVQEFINIANHIKNTIFLNQVMANNRKLSTTSPYNGSPTSQGKMRAEGFQQAKERTDKTHHHVSKAGNVVRSFIKGIISYLTDPWSLFNVVILACCLGNIIIWCLLLKGNNLYELLSFYNNDPTNTATKVTIYDSNYEMDKLTSHVILFQQFAAVNSMIMIAKLLKFIGATSTRLRALLSLLGNVTVKLVPFFILFLVFLISFMYMIHFMYGHAISEFSELFSIFRYLLTGIDYNYDQADNMINVNKGVTILFHIVYVFIILFILVSLIYVFLIHAFEDYITERKNEKKKNVKIKGTFFFNPHPIWRLKECVTVTVPMMFYQIFKRQKYKLEKSRIKNEKAQDEKELASYQNFDFDIDIRNKNEEQKDLNPLFNNEVKIKKILKEKKLKTVESFWGIIILWISFILLTIVATEHQRIYDGASAIHSLKYLFELDTFSTNNKYHQFDVAIDNLRTPGDVTNWVQKLFVYYPEQKNYTRKDNSTYFILESNLILTNQYRLTLRKRKMVSAAPSPYNMFYSELITDPFKANAKNPSGEEKSSKTVTRSDGTTYTYEYSEDDGYSNRGGYVITSMVPDFVDDFADIVSDGVIDNTYNSLVIDFPLYSTQTNDIMYVALIFEIDSGNKIDTTIDISYLGLNYYNSAGQRFIALIEVLTVIWFFVFSSRLILRFKSYEDFYDFWYSLYIAHFPAVIKKQRQKKEPEWVRRVVYMYGFSNIINICLLICYFVAAGLWITYLCQASIIQRQAKEFINLDTDANSSDLINNLQVNSNLLFASKLFESFFLFFIIIKILYFYSNFSQFNFLTITIKKSAKWIGLMLIIMLVFIIGFGFFLQNIRGPMQKEYSSFFNIIIEHMQALNALPPTGMALLTGNYDVFITIIYYIPWLIFVTYIILGVFTAIVYNGYKSAIKKQSEHNYDHVPIGIKEFLELTWELCRKKKKINKKMKFDFNEQIQEKFNNRKVFEEFDDNVNLAYTAKDMKLWATNCTKAIVQESEVRKSMKRTAKEIFKASTVDFDNKGNKHKKIMTDDEKLSHFELRAAYWNYFRFGSRKLLKHMSGFNQGIKALEGKVGDPEKKKENQVVDAKIKKYILQLEAQVSQNLQDVQNMRRTLDEFEKEKHNLMLDK